MKISKTIKIIIALLTTAAVIASWYLGSYLPLQKSRLYIKAYSSLSKVRSFEEFNKLFDAALDYYSPVGRDEIVQSYLGIITNLLNQEPPIPDETKRELVNQAEKRAKPILEKGKGFNFSQLLYNLGTIYRTAAFQLNDLNYYQKSVDVYRIGLEASPNRSVFLYNLLDLYLARGDKENAKKIGEIILKYWPDDEQVKRVIESLGN